MNDSSFEETIRPLLPHSFSDHHKTLLMICFNGIQPEQSIIEPLSSEHHLETTDLRRLYAMVLVEFHSSLKQELLGSDATRPNSDQKPNPYDVFYMEPTIQYPERHIAICLPRKCSSDCFWLNGKNEMVPLDEQNHKWRVASLSGPARVLTALAQEPVRLTCMSMKREMIVDVVDDTSALESLSLGDDMMARIKALNDSQRVALATAIDQRYTTGFFPIQGPPGCGKTTTLVTLIAVMNETILVVAPSNAAVANIALKLYEIGRFEFDEICVFGESTDQSAQFLNPLKRGSRFVKLLRQMEEADSNKKRQDQHRCDFIQWLHIDEQTNNMTMAELALKCPHYNMDSKSGRSAYARQLRNSKVIFATLNSAGSSTLQNNLEVSVLMLDEGGQTPEAEFFIATNFPGIKKIFVVGDPKQLPATVINIDCEKAGYGISWLEKVYNHHPNKVHLLDTQFRMDPQILAFPNNSFYRDRIMSSQNVLSRPPHVDKPFIFVDTCGRGQEERDGFSWKNQYECNVIRSIIYTDSDIQRLVMHPQSTRIIVIAPYRAQVTMLEETLDRPRGCMLEVATVDSFQGQEGDVVIVSTVRTRNIGFTDNQKRLNVALTRSKRILRVVGDFNFFMGFQRQSSTLRKLCEFATVFKCVESTKVKNQAWSPPNWDEEFIWKPVGNSRFYNCLKKLKNKDQHVCWNTLHAIAKPYLGRITGIPERKSPSWYITCLKGYNDCLKIVWIPKKGLDKPLIEAYFAGTNAECNRFVQKMQIVPKDASIARTDLIGIKCKLTCDPEISDSPVSLIQDQNEFYAAWPITNAAQNATRQGHTLPQAGVQLDSCQEELARKSPPLLCESRSGTGKTLALLQHAAFYGNKANNSAACFVTVSERLCKNLFQQYKELGTATNMELPSIEFFTFETLISKLVDLVGLGSSFPPQGRCYFPNYIDYTTRESHRVSSLDTHLVENEVGGVIVGSIDAALKRAPLSRSEYLQTKRSNIKKNMDTGINQRNLVYDEYERYVTWKREKEKYDLGDVIICLLQEKIETRYSAAYFDEVQDFSYAAIFLICNIAGKDTAYWVCAGDTAQMVSPGCSFTFSGLKDTLLHVRSGIESQLSHVNQLCVNYRTTADILYLGNEILSIARRHFPGSIAYALPERAKKDLGLKVLMCDWDECLSQSALKLGQNQALIYASHDKVASENEAKKWIGPHPFILSVIESKGLEFDDVIVAFSLNRNVWNITKVEVSSLKMMRELYVAVTRAKRRVVVLVKKSNQAMRDFFRLTVTYDFQWVDGKHVQLEFDQETTRDMWKQKGFELYSTTQYLLASRCFDRAGELGWSEYSNARHFNIHGEHQKAINHYHKAFVELVASQEYKHSLDVAKLLSEYPDWNEDNNTKLDLAIRNCPGYLTQTVEVQLNLLCNRWNVIDTEHLKDLTLAKIFVRYRNHANVIRIVREASVADRKYMEGAIPSIMGDFYKRGDDLDSAVKLYITANEKRSAENAMLELLGHVSTTGERRKQLSNCVGHWTKSTMKPDDPTIILVLDLYQQAPGDVTASKAKKYLEELGRSIIIESVDYKKMDRTVLYEFSRSDFLVEVREALESRFSQKLVEVVMWLTKKNSLRQASEYAKSRSLKWTNNEFCTIALLLSPPEEWIVREIHKRKIVDWYMMTLIGSSSMASNDRLDSVRKFFSRNLGIVLTSTGQSLAELVQSLFSESKNGKKNPEDIETIVRKHIWGYPWADLEKWTALFKTIHDLCQIMEEAEHIKIQEFPPNYLGFFKEEPKTQLN